MKNLCLFFIICQFGLSFGQYADRYNRYPVNQYGNYASPYADGRNAYPYDPYYDQYRNYDGVNAIDTVNGIARPINRYSDGYIDGYNGGYGRRYTNPIYRPSDPRNGVYRGVPVELEPPRYGYSNFRSNYPNNYGYYNNDYRSDDIRQRNQDYYDRPENIYDALI